ncbi:uncharacterized protein [Hoplias malabaricus]|uniref:uncharacterized protein n=1 Tax=Hoplias malabaricus TaxID=27720 RepID=UPI00346186BB
MTLSLWIGIFSVCCVLNDPVAFANENWSVIITQRVLNVAESSNVTINCKVKYPLPQKEKMNIQGFWKALHKGEMSIDSADKRNFIFHHNESFMLKSFRKRTKLIGNVLENNCSLSIINIQRNDTGQYYFRIKTGADNYSFLKDIVTIKLTNDTTLVTTNKSTFPDTGSTMIPVSTEASTTQDPDSKSMTISISVAVCLVLLVAVIVTVLIILLRRRKRKRIPVSPVTNYYENCQFPGILTSSHIEPKSTEKEEKVCEAPPTPEDEAVYANVQAGSFVKSSFSEPVENIYSNVGYDSQL